jgi:AcrR family transcriptional regulator
MPKIPASGRDAFYEARRRALADVALRLWAERGFDQTSVAAIAEEAGIAKGTFYLYFESKDALLLDVLRRNSFLPNVLGLIEDLQRRSLDEAVREFVRGAWQHLSLHRDLVLVALRELPTHLEQVQAVVERLIVPGNRALADHLETLISPERAQELSATICVRALIGMVVVVFITQEIMGAGRFLPVPEEQITNTIAELFLRGVAPTTSEVRTG